METAVAFLHFCKRWDGWNFEIPDVCAFLGPFTPWKINMEPTNHPFRKEGDLPNLHDYVPC